MTVLIFSIVLGVVVAGILLNWLYWRGWESGFADGCQAHKYFPASSCCSEKTKKTSCGESSQ